jgi:quercetin dioxygenase-like cupin family protein
MGGSIDATLPEEAPLKHGKSAAGRSGDRVKRVRAAKTGSCTAGPEAVQARGEFDAGGMVPKHTHPGEEIAC